MSKEKIYVIPEHEPTPMIPESDFVPVTQESDSISRITRSNSASVVRESDPPLFLEGTESKDGHVRRYSTGNVGIPYKSVKILSGYLAASVGSCHDYCNYEQRHDLETKTRINSILETIMEGQGTGQDIGKVLTLAERKKILAVNCVSSHGSRIQKPDIAVVSKQEVPSSTKKETVLFKQLSLPIKEVDPRPMPMIPTSPSLPINGQLNQKQYGEIQENNEMGTSLVTSHGASSGREQRKLRSTNKMKNSTLDGKKVLSKATASLPALHSLKKVLTRPMASVSPKRSVKRVSSMNTKIFKSLKGVSHVKDCSVVGKAEYQRSSNKSVPEKTSYVTGLNAENKAVKLTQHSDCSPSHSMLHKDKDSKHQKAISQVRLSLPSAAKILRRTRSGIHTSRSPKSPENESLRLTKEGIHVTGSSTSLASSKSNNGDNGGIFSEDPGTDINNRVVNAKVELRTRPRNGEAANTKDTNSTTRKLSFRKPKVPELHPVISSPRRLKLRRRELIDGQIGKVGTTESTIRNTKTHVDKGDANVGKSESKKVALKHQDGNDGGCFSEDLETDIDNRVVNAKLEPRTRPKNVGAANTKYTDSSTRKLSFRKAKVLELRPVINSPRRLKFRGRKLIDFQIGNIETTESTIKNTKTHVDEGDANLGKSESKKVVLNHQDVEGKKEEQNLLNEVIEGTAGKLAESRKSKVKALVSAFETVISRQDTSINS